jgi:2'-5' RNA ligase
MRFVLEFHFSSESEAFLQSLMQQLKELGLPRNLLEKGVTPHLTLFTDESLSVIKIGELDKLVASQQSFSLTLSSLGTFANEQGVLFLSPMVDKHLLEFHQAVHDCCEDSSDEVELLYKPGRWVPHITLGTKYSREQLAKALGGLELSLPREVKVSRLALVKYPVPLELLETWLFKTSQTNKGI